jgi:hypothetical protein
MATLFENLMTLDDSFLWISRRCPKSNSLLSPSISLLRVIAPASEESSTLPSGGVFQNLPAHLVGASLAKPTA